MALLGLGPAGCGSLKQAAERQKATNELKQVGLAWHNYYDANARCPAKPEDLFPFLDGPTSAASQALKSGRFVLVWDVNLPELRKTPAGMGGAAVGWASETPTSGGLVLMADGTVKTVTAAEYQALARPKAASVGGLEKKRW
jgi:hypothetical protein